METRDTVAVGLASLAVASVGCAVYVGMKKAAAERRVTELEIDLAAERGRSAHSEKLRQSERKGRTRAEQKLREQQQERTARSSEVTMRLIGKVESCFSQKNGTPRNYGYVTKSRANLVINRSIVSNPEAALEGLENFSHLWVLAVFHENTNLHSGHASPAQSKVKAKAHPPRLGGGSTGIFSCRTPHRPAPIALSLAKIEAVDHSAGVVRVSGLDLIDGTPILDLKPYVPLYDSQEEATCPQWIRTPVHGTAPVGKRSLVRPQGTILEAIEHHVKRKSKLFKNDLEGFLGLLEEVIAGEYDMRSNSRRVKMQSSNIENTHSVVLDGMKVVFHWEDSRAPQSVAAASGQALVDAPDVQIDDSDSVDLIHITAVTAPPRCSPCNMMGL